MSVKTPFQLECNFRIKVKNSSLENINCKIKFSENGKETDTFMWKNELSISTEIITLIRKGSWWHYFHFWIFSFTFSHHSYIWNFKYASCIYSIQKDLINFMVTTTLCMVNNYRETFWSVYYSSNKKDIQMIY